MAQIKFNPGTTVCTSTTRPPTPFQGQVILETDTGNEYFWSGSVWRLIFADSGQITIAALNGPLTIGGTGCWYRKIGLLVQVHFDTSYTGAVQNGYTACTIPVGYRPVSDYHLMAESNNTASAPAMVITASGNIAHIGVGNASYAGGIQLDAMYIQGN